jgi:hypothetical protein
MSTRAVLAALGSALVLVAAACAGGEGDKAGGEQQAQPLVLTLESEDDLSLTGAPEFAAAVDRLSEGSMRVALVPAGRSTEIEWEKGVVEDTAGRRSWDRRCSRLGHDRVKSPGDARPFLVDSRNPSGECSRALATRCSTASSRPVLSGSRPARRFVTRLVPHPCRAGLPRRDDQDSRPSMNGAPYLGCRAGDARRAVRPDGADSNPKAIDYNSGKCAHDNVSSGRSRTRSS